MTAPLRARNFLSPPGQLYAVQWVKFRAAQPHPRIAMIFPSPSQPVRTRPSARLASDLTIPTYVIVSELWGGRSVPAEKAASAWLARTARQNHGGSCADMEQLCRKVGFSTGSGQIRSDGTQWSQIEGGKHRSMSINLRDSVARTCIKFGLLDPLPLEAVEPVRELAMGTTRGFDYANFSGPPEYLAREEAAHAKQAIQALERRRMQATKAQGRARLHIENLVRKLDHCCDFLQDNQLTLIDNDEPLAWQISARGQNNNFTLLLSSLARQLRASDFATPLA